MSQFFYVAVVPDCGCVIGGALDRGNAETAKWVTWFIKGGCRAVRVEGPVQITSCPHRGKSRRQRQTVTQIGLL
jgi:hypothetical protein